MTTKRESILDQIKTTLAGTTNVSTRIYRSRVTAVTRSETPCLLIEPLGDEPDQGFSLPRLNWSLSVRVSIIVRGDIPDEIADPIIESVHAKMTADLTLGGYALDVQPGSVGFQMVDSDQPSGIIEMDFLIKYRTLVNDLTSG
tara:strand:- start:4030 stop:4458 length:429 start_codon:yes stop_codon:yes gene_type:complete